MGTPDKIVTNAILLHSVRTSITAIYTLLHSGKLSRLNIPVFWSMIRIAHIRRDIPLKVFLEQCPLKVSCYVVTCLIPRP